MVWGKAEWLTDSRVMLPPVPRVAPDLPIGVN